MNGQEIKYYFDDDKRFIIENYNWSKPFSNFLPGIAGKWGIPLWVYYVNRVQGISSMGVRDKDNAIMEFFSFNKACQLIGNQGFRTFIKTDGNNIYEPFKPSKDKRISQKMIISAEEFAINDINSSLGIQVNVEYFPLVNLPVAGLVRKVSIFNQRNSKLKLEIADGLPLILPFGMNQHCIKFIARHIEAMMQVETIDGIPLFKLKQVPLDIPQVQEIKGGNFYFTFLPDQNCILNNNYVVDPESIFGETGEFEYPWVFAENSIEKILTSNQTYENKTPCALTLICLDIPGNNEIVFYSIIGNTSSEERLVTFKNYLGSKNIAEKKEENQHTIQQIEDKTFTVSSNTNFDNYCGQTYLDNVMRGGLPVVFESSESKNVFYLYSRKHGDLERDYNYFVLEQTYLSQGNSHYRDVNQNRRNDVWFNPEVVDSNIIMLMNLIQTDGFNPLVVNGLTYTARNISGLKTWFCKIIEDSEIINDLLTVVKRPFTPGEFIMKIEEIGTDISLDYNDIITVLLSFCKQNDVGEIHEGYWIDHWTYNLDLIDNYLMIFPDRLKELLVDKQVYTFYDNPDIVMPRNKKYVLVDGKIRQYDAVIRDKEKINLIKTRQEDFYKVRKEYGKGKVYSTNLLVKMLCIIANKISSLDPDGIGIEMEADKPGWYDPLNGLPALMASSLCETLELRRACEFLIDAILKINLSDDESIYLFEELYIFIIDLHETIEKRINSGDKNRALLFWDKSHKIKEDYREKTKFGISEKLRELKILKVKEFLNKCLRLLDNIFSDTPRDKLFHRNGVCYTYFLNEVKRFEHIYLDNEKKNMALSSSCLPLITPLEFKQKPLSLFLEGSVHLLKVKKELANEIYKSIKNSRIYDDKLNMFKTSEPLTSETYEIGRARAYPPGWIENESVYLHMEYKFLLELLKAGLYEEYFTEIKKTLIPFLNPEIYGRSILENSSFIVSSSFPNKELHGRGFQPRLTGASAEFLTMWIIMVAGQNPYFIDNKKNLKLKLKPILPNRFFTKKEKICKTYMCDNKMIEVTIPMNCFAFKFSAKTVVIYHNEKRKNTFGKDGARITSYILKYTNGKLSELEGDILDTIPANDVRNGCIERIDVFLD